MKAKGKTSYSCLQVKEVYNTEGLDLVNLNYPNITHLSFTDNFNAPITKLPPTLTHLTFGREYNKPISFTWPPALFRLQFGSLFNQPIELPNTLIQAIFGFCFNKPLAIPPSLQTLCLDVCYDTPLPTLPSSSLKELCLGCSFKQILDLPKTLTYLTFTDRVEYDNDGTYES
jgi:FNIP Repeat